jgi:hypothetical protein
MRSHSQAVAALAQVTDEALFGTPKDDLVDRVYALLGRVSFDGIALRAPARIEMEQRSTVPLVVVIERGDERARSVPLRDNAIVLVTRDASAESWATEAFPVPEGKIPPRVKVPHDPPPPDPTKRMKKVDLRDLRAAGALPWRPGRYVVRLLAWDWMSNPVAIAVTDAAAAPPARVVVASVPAGAEGPPHFTRTPESPALEAPGVALALPSAPVQIGAPVLASGSLRLAPEPGWPRTAEGASVVPATLVLVRLGVPVPLLINLRIPLQAGARPGSEVESHFFLDLSKSAARPLAAAEYRAWLVSGEHASGAVPLRLVR